MNNLLKTIRTSSTASLPVYPYTSCFNQLFQRTLSTLSKSSPQSRQLLDPTQASNGQSLVDHTQSSRSLYSFRFPNNKLHKYKRATRPKLSGDNSIKLTYEQTQFAEELGVTKSWNNWNTCKQL